MTHLSSLLSSAAPLACLLCYVLGYRRGLTRGRELEQMEPPRDGEWHFREGPITVVRAESGSNAVDELLASLPRKVTQ